MIDLRDDKVFYIQLLIALANLALFGLAFALMGYFELIGSDPTYYDDRTYATIKMINNLLLDRIGHHFDPHHVHKVNTLLWAALLGCSLVSSFFAIVIGNRKPIEEYEVTEAKK